MKINFSLLILLALVATLPALAEKEEADHPCVKVKAACEAAGFKKGAHKDGKGLIKDCIKKVMDGETVVGVTVPAEEVTACKEKRVEHQQKREVKRMENAGKVGPGKTHPTK